MFISGVIAATIVSCVKPKDVKPIVRLMGRPVAKLVGKSVGKVTHLALSILPFTSGLWNQYQALSLALDFAKYNAVRYDLKEEGDHFSGETPHEIGEFFKQKVGNPYIKNWNIFESNFNESDPTEVLDLLKQVYLYTSDPDLLQLRTAQVLAKKLISWCAHAIDRGFKMEVPVVNSTGERELVEYALDHKFNILDDIPAFGFVDPKDRHPPILIFQPTNCNVEYVDTFPSLIANLHPKGPAWKLYKNSQKEVAAWLKQKTCEGENKARIIGYSQGGALASYFLCNHSEWISQKKHQPSFILDAPGLSKSVTQNWHALKEKPHVLTYVTRGDLIPKVGPEFIGRAFEVSIPQKMSAFEAHKAMSTFSKMWNIHEIDLEKETHSRFRKAFSGAQKVVGSIFYPILRSHIVPKIREIYY